MILSKDPFVWNRSIPFLEKKWENSFDSLTQQRILNIIHNIQFDTICTELDHWIKFDSKNLFAAFMLITRYQYPDVNEDDIKQKIGGNPKRHLVRTE